MSAAPVGSPRGRERPDHDETDAIEISVVIPCLNEEANVAGIYAAVRAQLEQHARSFEILFIDNGSTDRTIPLLRALAADDRLVRVILNNRNYGQMRSPTHAIYQTAGAATIGMCADFQDPPSLIGEMIARWRAGARIVLGVRAKERASLLTQAMRGVGYAFLSRFGDYPLIPGATGFGLYDREVVECLVRWHEPEPFFRGMLVESGFALETIAYTRPERAAGTSKNDVFAILDFGVSGIAGSSKRLLRLPIHIALLGSIPTLALLLLSAVFLARGVPAFQTFLTSLVMGCGITVLFFVGLMGEQVRMISERTRNVPLVVEQERINFPASRSAPR